MMISVYCGAGLNFALPLGIICGLLGGSIAIEINATGLPGFLLACAISIPFALLVGWLYGRMLNKVRGSEMAVGNYMAFCIVYLFCVLWLVLPYKNPLIIWPVGGKGLRVTLTLDNFFSQIFDNFLMLDFRSLSILQESNSWKNFSFPTGLILVFAVACFIMWVFTKTKAGVILRIGGAYPKFSKSLGISNDRSRIVGSMASMTMAAIGINIYSQSYGFYQFYNAPLKMAFPAMAALLIGGATVKKASVFNVVFGAIIYVGLLAMGTPITNILMNTGSLSEIVRMIVQNGIILYALTKINSGGK
jgi:simple sugar transport system permease protein